MISGDLLQVLRCPETRQSLAMADAALVGAINERIAARQVRTRGGNLLAEPIEEALLRADGEVLYPIRGGIPIMLIDEAVLMPVR